MLSTILMLFSLPGTAAEVITLEVWHEHNPATHLDGRELANLYREYEQLNPHIKINQNVMTYADLRQKAIVAHQAGDGPDLLHMLGEWVAEFATLGAIEDITDRVEAWEKDAFPDVTWAVASRDGRIYGIPSIASTRTLVYRADLLEQAGIDNIPATWDELRDAAKKLTQPGVAGFAFCSSTDAVRGPQEFLVLLWSTGADIAIQENGKWVPGFTVEQVEDVYQLYYDLMFVDESTPLYARGWEYNDMDQAFEVGTVAMTQNGAWMRNRATRAETGEFWETAPFPYQKEPATYMEVKVEAIGAHSNHKDEAWKLLKWLMSKEQMFRISQYTNLPARIDVMSLPFYQEDVVWRRTFLDAIPSGRVIPSIPLTPVLRGSMERLQEVLYEVKTPRQAAEDFYRQTAEHLSTIN